MKTIKEDYVRRNILREALIMKKIEHRNIVKLYETLKHNHLYCLVTELVRGGDLRSYVQLQKTRKISENKARLFFRQLLSAVKHLHDNNIVHRDLKMDNILLNEAKNSIKLVDFGLSNSFNKDELLKTHCGSPEYAAPELFEKGCLYGPSVDIWSMGVILYAMVIGHLPFSTIHGKVVGRDDLHRNAKKGLTILHEKYLIKLTTGCRNLLGKILQPDPTKRITLEEVTHHLWITENGKNPLIKHLSPMVPKSIRNKVINCVASLFSSSTVDMESRVEYAKHDAVCAVYNLLLDAAMKGCSSRSKAMVTASDSGGNSVIAKPLKSEAFAEAESAKMQKKSVVAMTPSQSGRVRTPDSLTGKSQAKSFSSIKIIEFTDAIKLEGRAKSPIIRKPSSAKTYQRSKGAASCNESIANERSKNEAIAQSDVERRAIEAKKQFCCDEVTNPTLAACCRITRFPEEDKTAKRSKVEIRPSLLQHDSKQLSFTAGFNRALSFQRRQSNASLTSNTSSHSGRQSTGSDKKKTEKQLLRLRRTSLPSDLLQSGRKLEAGSRSYDNTTTTEYNKRNASWSRVASHERVGSAFTELRKRSGSSLHGTGRARENRALKATASLPQNKQVKRADSNNNRDLEKTEVEGEKKYENLAYSVRNIDGVRVENHFSNDKYKQPEERKRKQQFLPQKVWTNSLELSSFQTGLDRGAEINSCPSFRRNSPHTRRFIAYLETQRKSSLSLGILKIPSKCSSIDVGSPCASERRNLKVTFEDEVIDKHVKNNNEDDQPTFCGSRVHEIQVTNELKTNNVLR
eukprot:gene18285-20110_t